MPEQSITSRVAHNLDRLMRENPALNTQQKLAKHSGIGQSNIGRIRRGDISQTVDTLDAVARAFGLTAADLLLDHKVCSDKAGAAASEIKTNRLARLMSAMTEAQIQALEVSVGHKPDTTA